MEPSISSFPPSPPINKQDELFLPLLELPNIADGPGHERDELAAPTSPRPYIWQPAGSQRRISLELSVVDQILQEAMRGLGAVPKRGAEIGGVLLGSITEDGTVCITSSVPVPCSHAQGSSFTLTTQEFDELTNTVARFEPGKGKPTEAVGFYRSHTREGFGLSMDDARFLDALFPGDWPVILLVKPSITRVSQGAFFFREDGAVHRGSSYLEFPFRRRELGGRQLDEQSDEQAATDTAIPASPAAPAAAHALDSIVKPDKKRNRTSKSGGGMFGFGSSRAASATISPTEGDSAPTGRAESGRSTGSGSGSRRRWALIPLSFLFLLLGLFLGLQAALVIGPHLGRPADPFSLGLRIKPLAGHKLQIDWNLASAPVTGAQDATLYIEDGGATKTVPLTRTQLTSTAIEYPALNNNVHVRLAVRLRDSAIYSESADIRLNSR